MLDISLDEYHQYLQLTESDGKRYIYDPIRKKHLSLQPEELVRQSWIQYLIKKFNINPSSIAIEKQLKVGSLSRRFDLVLYKKAIPFVLFEFKSFKSSINNNTCFQAAQYNLELKVPFMILSNGLQHFAFKIDFEGRDFQALNQLSFLEKK